MWKVGLLVFALVSCNSSAPGATCADPSSYVLNGSVSTAQLGGGCDDNLPGSAVGSPCKNGGDCAPICCGCPGTAAGSVSVGYCTQGVCATKEEACCTFAHQALLPDAGGLCP